MKKSLISPAELPELSLKNMMCTCFPLPSTPPVISSSEVDSKLKSVSSSFRSTAVQPVISRSNLFFSSNLHLQSVILKSIVLLVMYAVVMLH